MKNKKHKLRASDVIFPLIILAGVLVFLVPEISNVFARMKAKSEIKDYAEIAGSDETDYSEYWTAAEEYNAYLRTKPDQFTVGKEELDYTYTLLDPLGNSMIGHISIPKINVDIPIFHGIEEVALQSGAGWWPGTSLPTGGESTHCVITAHTGLAKAKYFTDLDRLETGDRFTLTVLDRTLTYEVDQILVALPEETSELRIKDGMDYVTLYTCTPYGVNTHRLLVRGVRVPDEPSNDISDQPELPTNDRNGNGLKLAVILAICAAVILIIIIKLIIKHQKRKKQKRPAGRRPAKHITRSYWFRHRSG